jgi:hypothetical protein
MEKLLQLSTIFALMRTTKLFMLLMPPRFLCDIQINKSCTSIDLEELFLSTLKLKKHQLSLRISRFPTVLSMKNQLHPSFSQSLIGTELLDITLMVLRKAHNKIWSKIYLDTLTT